MKLNDIIYIESVDTIKVDVNSPSSTIEYYHIQRLRRIIYLMNSNLTKPIPQFDFCSNFAKAIDYIEQNVYEEIDYKKISEIMICSEEHLIRMFPFITGISLSEYIRRRKITLAGYELLKSHTRILDISLKYGYGSQTSFARTFKNYHGVTPSQIQKGQGTIKAYPLMKLNLSLEGMDTIAVRTESTNPFQLFGYGEIELKNGHYHSYDFIINYGNKIVESGWHEKINKEAGFYKDDCSEFHLLHSFIFKKQDKKTYFMYGWEAPEGGVNREYTVLPVEKKDWIVFQVQGNHMDCLPKIWTYFYTDRNYHASYDLEYDIIIEKETFISVDDDLVKAEVWIPIKHNSYK